METVNKNLDKLSHILTTHIPDDVKNFYSAKYNELQDGVCLFLSTNWYGNTSADYSHLSPSAISTLVHYVLWEAYEHPVIKGEPPMSADDAYNDYRLAKKNKKDFLHRVIREEYEVFTGKQSLDKRPKTTKYLHESWTVNSNPFLGDKQVKITQLAFYQQEYEKVRNWHKNHSDYIFHFPYFDTLPIKSRVLYIIQDIGWLVFNIIKNEFYGNLEGYLTKTPDLNFGIKTSGLPLVNWNASPISLQDLRFDSTEDSVTVYEVLENGGVQVKIIVDIIRNLDCSTPEKKTECIDKIRKQYESGERVGRLDTTDYTILAVLLNLMNYEIVTGKKDFTVSFIELALRVYSDETSISLKKCNAFFERLVKLSKMSLSFAEMDESGVSITGGIRDFFTLKRYFISSFSSGGKEDFYVPKSLEYDLTGEASILNTSNFTKDHYNHMTLLIEPGEYLKSQYISHLSVDISTKVYQSLPSSKAKVLIKILIEDRLRNLDTLTSRLSMIFLQTQIRVASGAVKRLKQEIVDILYFLKTNSILIKDYKVNRTSFDIYYLNLSYHEKLIYGYEPPILLEDKKD